MTLDAEDLQGLPITTTVQIDLREPRPNRSAQAGALIAWVEPYTRRLEEIWDGSSAIRVAGLEPTTSNCTFQLAQRPGAIPLASRTFPIELPLSSETWRRILREKIQSDTGFQNAYQEATWARIVIESGRLGRNDLEFERELPPLRWSLKEGRDESFLMLHDDTELDDHINALFAPYSYPDRWERIRIDGKQPIKAASTGGLYRAETKTQHASIIVPPVAKPMRSFADLGIQPKLSPRPRKAGALSDLVVTMGWWATARLPGHALAHFWRVKILQALQGDLFSLLCGHDWRRAEQNLDATRSEVAYTTLSKLVVRSRADHVSVAGALINNTERFLNQTLEERVEDFHSVTRRFPEYAGPRWRELARRRGEEATLWMSEFSLRAASDARVAMWAGPFTEGALDAILEWPLPARAARCLAMASLLGSNHQDFPPLLPDWEWSQE